MKLYRGLLFTTLLLLIISCNKKDDKKEAIRPVFYQKISESIKPGIKTFAGISKAKSEAKLSFKVGGILEKIYYNMGQKVKKGKILAYLNSTDYRINYDKALANKKNAEVQLITAKSSFIRIENLYANNNASLNDYEKAKARYETAKAMVKTATAQLEAARNQLNYTKLYAPYNGTIANILAEENEMIGPGRPVLIFSSDSDVEIKTGVPESIVRFIKIGQKATIKFSAVPNRTFEGIVSEIGLSSGPSSTFPIIIRLVKQSDKLLPGMACTIDMKFDINLNENSIIIPSDAVAHDEGGDFVYVVEKSNTEGIYIAKRRNVTLGKLTATGYEVKKGLTDQDIIITAGLRFMYDGRKVKLLNNFN